MEGRKTSNCRFDRPTRPKKTPSKPKKINIRPGLRAEAGQGFVLLELPVKAVSEANCSEHWTKKHKRHKAQKKLVYLALRSFIDRIFLPCHIKLTRYGSRKLDKHDNLPISFKYILDMLCGMITGDLRPGRADDDDRISVSYDQVQNKQYYVTVLITF